METIKIVIGIYKAQKCYSQNNDIKVTIIFVLLYYCPVTFSTSLTLETRIKQ